MLDTVAEEVRALVEQCHQRALTLLQENRWRLDSLAQRVLEKETLDEHEIYAAAGLHRSASDTRRNENQRVNRPAQVDTK
jgi:cell division protease FtsH